MLKDMDFSTASDLYQNIKTHLDLLYQLFGEAGVEAITDALHLYAESGFAEECCTFDLDFCHLFCLAVRDKNGYDVKPEYSCLTNWSGAKWP